MQSHRTLGQRFFGERMFAPPDRAPCLHHAKIVHFKIFVNFVLIHDFKVNSGTKNVGHMSGYIQI